jgi:hypothetical protein
MTLHHGRIVTGFIVGIPVGLRGERNVAGEAVTIRSIRDTDMAMEQDFIRRLSPVT